MAHSSCTNQIMTFRHFLDGWGSVPPNAITCTMNQSSCEMSYGPTAPYETKSYAVAAGNWVAGYGWFEWYCWAVTFSVTIEDLVSNPEDYSLLMSRQDYGGSPSVQEGEAYEGVTGYVVIRNDHFSHYHTMCQVAVKVYATDDLIPSCPIGGWYDGEAGQCEPLPGWEHDGSGGFIKIDPGMPIGEPNVPGELPPYYTEDPTVDPGGDQAGCYVLDTETGLYVYDDTIEGCDGSDCIKAASCIVEPSLDLIPDDIDSILPPGYVDEGSLPGINQPTDSITAGCVKDDSIIECDTEDDVTTKTGCSIIPEC